MSVSPDGRWIAFLQGGPHGRDVYKLPLEGGTPVQLTFDGSAAYWPGVAWSPDGSEIAFVANEPAGAHVWVVAAGGGPARRLGSTRVFALAPRLSWAPGRFLLAGQEDLGNILVIDPVSGRARPLVGAASGTLRDELAAPDGDRVAAGWYRGGVFGLWLFSLQGRSPRLLTTDAWSPIGWTPDEQFVYAMPHPLVMERTPMVLRVNVSSGRVDTVLTDRKSVV